MAQARLLAKMLRDPTALGDLWRGPGYRQEMEGEKLGGWEGVER